MRAKRRHLRRCADILLLLAALAGCAGTDRRSTLPPPPTPAPDDCLGLAAAGEPREVVERCLQADPLRQRVGDR